MRLFSSKPHVQSALGHQFAGLVECPQAPVAGQGRDFPQRGVDGVAFGRGAEFSGICFQRLVVERRRGATGRWASKGAVDTHVPFEIRCS